jgi:hypothetical protein
MVLLSAMAIVAAISTAALIRVTRLRANVGDLFTGETAQPAVNQPGLPDDVAFTKSLLALSKAGSPAPDDFLKPVPAGSSSLASAPRPR